MLASYLILFGLICAAQAHVTSVGSRGPLPHDPNFFKADGTSPCPDVLVETSRYEVFAGTTFPVSWSLWVNHNAPPNPIGFVNFNLWNGNVTEGGSNFTPMGQIPIVNQFVQVYFNYELLLPSDLAGDATIQVYYDINGAPSPFPGYFQCIDLFVLPPP
mmetsp:Transcript_19650/g.27088  ORF Transcript_19650/g.27088 Transcript_19650/m.27088 type:complete len:159 (-) Transcript_19650:52-528(-)